MKRAEIPFYLRRPAPGRHGSPMPPEAILHWREEDQRRWAKLAGYGQKARAQALAEAPAEVLAEALAESSHAPGPPQLEAASAAVAAPETPAVASPVSIPPAPEPPPIDQTLDAIAEFIRRYLVCSDHQLTVLVLWVVHTYCFDYFPATPYLNIFSPENQSGKTVCLQLLNLLACKPWMPSGLTASRMIGRIGKSQATLLLDDWNTVIRPSTSPLSDAQPIIGVLNAGSTGGHRDAPRPENENSGPSIFCPKAFAGLGCLPPSLADRCIPVALKRLKMNESVHPFWLDMVRPNASALVGPLPAWVDKNWESLRVGACDFLYGSSSRFILRHRDFVAPLIAIAGVAGARWLRKARTALYMILQAGPVDPPSAGLQLLSDIRDYFSRCNDPARIYTTQLLEHLNQLDDRPWKKQKLTPVKLRIILRNFPIHRSASQRMGKKSFKGFTFQNFVESWQCYLPHLPSRRLTPAGAGHPQPGADGPKVGAIEDQVGASRIQVGANATQVGANSPPNPEISNAFNVAGEQPLNAQSLGIEEIAGADPIGSRSSPSVEANRLGDAVPCPRQDMATETQGIQTKDMESQSMETKDIETKDVKTKAMKTKHRATVPDPAQSVDEGAFVEINGAHHWVTVRGSDVNNPVLFILHGTGFALSSMAPLFAPWQKDFTIVQWDQPGAGATCARNSITRAEPLTLDGITRDGIAVIDFVRRRLQVSKLIAMGLSGGSIIGLKMVKQRPDLFSAYLGSGQFVHWACQASLSYATVLERARDARDEKAVLELEQIGFPPYRSIVAEAVKSKYATALTPSEQAVLPVIVEAMKTPPADAAYIARELPPFDARAVSMATCDKLRSEMTAFDARRLGLSFDLPIFFFQGEHDACSVTSEVRAYEAEIQAPKKMMVLIKGGGHSSFLMRDEFLTLMNTHVRPAVVKP